jgi:hypothetical protein
MPVPSATELEPIAREHGLKLIVLFGSQASGSIHPEEEK